MMMCYNISSWNYLDLSQIFPSVFQQICISFEQKRKILFNHQTWSFGGLKFSWLCPSHPLSAQAMIGCVKKKLWKKLRQIEENLWLVCAWNGFRWNLISSPLLWHLCSFVVHYEPKYSFPIFELSLFLPYQILTPKLSRMVIIIYLYKWIFILQKHIKATFGPKKL